MFRGVAAVLGFVLNMVGVVAFLVSFRFSSDEVAPFALVAAFVCALNLWAWLEFPSDK